MCILRQLTQREVQDTPRNFVGLTWWNNPEMPRETGRGPFLVNIVFVKTWKTCRKLVGRTVMTCASFHCLLNFWVFFVKIKNRWNYKSRSHNMMISCCKTTYFAQSFLWLRLRLPPCETTFGGWKLFHQTSWWETPVDLSGHLDQNLTNSLQTRNW